jgi:rfaE bifunctional protein nucleotidyltransferase chain/domain
MLLDRYKHKIRTAAELAAALGPRPRERKVIMCHGVFDIVHPGHLRHLIYAKSKADVLVASLTADIHIGKGQYRPHVPEELRATNLAALEVVDYVVVDPNPSPGAILHTIQPDYYIKGYEYTPHVRGKTISEAAVVEAYGGEVLYSPGDIVYSSSKILTDATPPLPVEKLQLLMHAHGLTFDGLRRAVEDLAQYKVHVVGDTIVDSYTYGAMIGGQTKTPTISALYERREDYVGAAAVIAKHARAAGATVHFTTLLGGDRLGEMVLDDLASAGVTADAHLEEARPTTNKNVFVVAGYRMLKMDTVDNRPISQRTLSALERAIADQPTHAVLYADFRHGIFNAQTIPTLAAAAPAGAIRAADSQVASRWGNITEFQNFDLLTPNEREARFSLGDQDTGVRPLATKLQQLTKCKHLIMKLGARGVLACGDAEFFALESFAGAVLDPVGAGDALAAYSTLSLLATRSLPIASILGSIAAALECEVDGNVPITAEQVLGRLDVLKEECG